MPEFQLQVGDDPGACTWFDSRDEFTQGYIEAMFFMSTGPDNEEEGLGSDVHVAMLSAEARERICRDCMAFQLSKPYKAARDSNGYGNTDFEPEQAGRDFWFTRNGHGVGFWDRDADVYGPHADRLTDFASTFNQVDLYKGDDGLLYLM